MRRILFVLLIAIINSIGYSQTKIDKINLLIIKKNYTEALQLSDELIQNYPDSAYYYYQNALVNKLIYRYPDALSSIHNALLIDPENIDYLLEYGILLDKKGKELEAAHIFKNILSQDPNQIYSGIWLSNYYMKERKHKEAKNILLNLYSADTSNSYFARNIGLCNIKLLDKVNSIFWLGKALELDSTDIKASEYLALVYTSLEKFDLAIDLLNKAIRLEPENKELYVKLGDIHVLRNHHFQAIPAFLKAFELDPKDEFIAKSIGMSYFGVKKYDKAKIYLDFALQSGLSDMNIYENLGYIHAEKNQLDSSNYYFNEALKLVKPDNGTIFSLKESLAANYCKMNNFEEAIEILKEALELELTDGYWISYRKNKLIIDIAAIYNDKLNDKIKAIKYYEKVIAPEIAINKNYYEYAQGQITKLKEELFFEGKIKN